MTEPPASRCRRLLRALHHRGHRSSNAPRGHPNFRDLLSCCGWRRKLSLQAPLLALGCVQFQVAGTAEPNDEQWTRIVGVVAFAVGVSATSAGLLPQLATQPVFVREHPNVVLSSLLCC